MPDQREAWRKPLEMIGPEAGVELLNRSPNDMLQRWSVPKRVNSFRADPEDPTRIEALALATPAAPV